MDPIRCLLCPFFLRLLTGKRRYNIKLWKTFTDCFNCLPVAAIVDEKIFCMHGGLSPELNDMDQIKRVLRPTDVPDTGDLRFFVNFRVYGCSALFSSFTPSFDGGYF